MNCHLSRQRTCDWCTNMNMRCAIGQKRRSHASARRRPQRSRLEAQLWRVEAERDSALNKAQAKQKEVDELSRICDDLIARVDPALPASPPK